MLAHRSGAPTFQGKQRSNKHGSGAKLILQSPAGNKTNDFKRENHYDALLQTLQQIDLIHCIIEKYPSALGFATTSAEVWDVFRSGRVASLIGVEGLHQIANSASVLRMLHRLGVRYVTLTHSQNNLYADSAVWIRVRTRGCFWY